MTTPRSGTPRSDGEDRKALSAVSLKEVDAARSRIAGLVTRTPLVPLEIDDAPANVYLKLENLQPTGSFKVRGAGNAILQIPEIDRRKGVFTCSAGNMAQALAWHARRLGIGCTVLVPDTAPPNKLEGIRRYGATVVQLPWRELWQVATTGSFAPLKEMTFIHPFADARMMAANGTIALEILEDLPAVDSVVVPFGGGGLIGGIAAVLAARRPTVRVVAAEPETAAPLAASFAAGSAQEVVRTVSFVDGIGASSVLPGMWGLLKDLVDGSIVVSLREIATAVKLLVERSHIVAEGAGAASVAAALTGKAGRGRIVCVVSGGNISVDALTAILNGGVP